MTVSDNRSTGVSAEMALIEQSQLFQEIMATGFGAAIWRSWKGRFPADEAWDPW